MTRRSIRIQGMLAALIVACATAHVGAWSLQQAPLMTRWAAQVDPQAPLPEYPRPQMHRTDWQNLNGVWQFQPGSSGDPVPTGQTLSGDILVPFPVESAISGVMHHYDRLWYRRTFEVPTAWAGQRVLLHFGAVDWESEVYINGDSVGVHTGGYDDFSYDITNELTGSGPQELIVRVFDPTDTQAPALGKQRLNPGGIWYTAVTGIWQTVWLEPVPAAHVETLRIIPDIDAGQVAVSAAVTNPAGLTLAVEARDALEAVVATGSAAANATVDLAIPDAHLWSPEDPYLYNLTVQLKQGSTVVDEMTSYFGMRNVAVEQVEGITRITLNGEFVWEIGPLDQGWWPDGLYTAPTDEALRWDIETTKELGFNMARKHVKIEPARWYYWTDKLGLLVWQDMPSMTAGRSPTTTEKAQFEIEMEQMVKQHWNHPSIIMWVVFNEGWGQYDTVRLTDWVMAMDPYRVVNNASGWTDEGAGHIIDHHSYPWPAGPAPSATRASVAGEYGGIGYAIENHLWSSGSWGYTQVNSSEELLALYGTYLQRAMGYADAPGISAAVYTQITDVEVEINGLVTYDREIIKAPAEEIAAMNTQHLKTYSQVVSTSETTPQTWRYTTSSVPIDWYYTQYDDSAWNTGPGGFGTATTPGAIVGTTWNTADIYLRRDFMLPDLAPDELERLALRIHHDEDAQVYINNVLAGSYGAYTVDYVHMPMSKTAKAMLRPGQTNSIAVHCHQTGGGQYIDVGLAMEDLPEDQVCGQWGYATGDVNRDCAVNITDFSLFLADWLGCTQTNQPDCINALN